MYFYGANGLDSRRDCQTSLVSLMANLLLCHCYKLRPLGTRFQLAIRMQICPIFRAQRRDFKLFVQKQSLITSTKQRKGIHVHIQLRLKITKQIQHNN